MMIRETILICLVISEGLWAREVIVVSGTDNYGKQMRNEKIKLSKTHSFYKF